MKQKRKNGKGDERSQAELMVMAIADIIQELVAAQQTGKDVDVNRLKTAVSARYGLRAQPRRVDLIAAAPPPLRNLLLPQLRAKPVRTASGVAVVAVMCKPHRCPHINFTGNICVYCPGGPDSDFEYSTQSYTGYEPTSMRAIRARYDPYLQTRHRVEQLQQLGHSVDKVEFVLMGGTFMALPEDYREFFIRSLHDALSGHTSATVAEAIRHAERSRSRCVGMTIETRPDFCLRPHLSAMLGYGCTRLEIGVQSVYEDVARDTNRGHTVRAVSESFHLAKDSGFKVVAHMMPDLPNVGLERDMDQFFFDKWTDSQRRRILLDLLERCSLSQQKFCARQLQARVPVDAVDFTTRIPRVLSLYIFSFLDPRSLCRCAQVSWHWKNLSELDQLWMLKCLRFGWRLRSCPSPLEQGAWKQLYIQMVRELRLSPPKTPSKAEFIVIDVQPVKSHVPEGKRPAAGLGTARGKKELRPWRSSDRNPTDTVRYNYLDNHDPIEQARQARSKGGGHTPDLSRQEAERKKRAACGRTPLREVKSPEEQGRRSHPGPEQAGGREEEESSSWTHSAPRVGPDLPLGIQQRRGCSSGNPAQKKLLLWESSTEEAAPLRIQRRGCQCPKNADFMQFSLPADPDPIPKPIPSRPIRAQPLHPGAVPARSSHRNAGIRPGPVRAPEPRHRAAGDATRADTASPPPPPFEAQPWHVPSSKHGSDTE